MGWYEELLSGIKDTNGNILYVNKGEVLLRLKTEIRKLGTLKEDRLEVIRTKRHYMEVVRGWGFNHLLLSKLPRDMEIRVRGKKGAKGYYKTTVGRVLDEGKFLHFLQQGFERQIFVCKDIFEIIL